MNDSLLQQQQHHPEQHLHQGVVASESQNVEQGLMYEPLISLPSSHSFGQDRKPAPASNFRPRLQFQPLEVDNNPGSFGGTSANLDHQDSEGVGISHLMKPSAASHDPERQQQSVHTMEQVDGPPEQNQQHHFSKRKFTISTSDVKRSFSPKSHGIMNGAHAGLMIVSVFACFLFYYFWVEGGQTPVEDTSRSPSNKSNGGFQPSSSSQQHSGTSSFGDELWSMRKERFHQAFWFESASDDYLYHVHVNEKLMRQMDQYRQLQDTVSPVFDEMCGRYRFSQGFLPPVSVVIAPVYPNMPTGLLSMTVHSILARTPENLLKEIVIVLEKTADQDPPSPDDNEATEGFARELFKLSQLSDKIRMTGCIDGCRWRSRAASRVLGFKEATMGDVVVFMDPYLEVLSSTWLEHLVLPLVEDPRTIAVPVLHHMDLAQRQYSPGDLNASSYFVNLNDDLDMVHVRQGFGGGNTPSTWTPHDTPFMESWIFAVDRNEFKKLYEIDSGLFNTECDSIGLSLKYQMCHGRILMVPCSRVGRIRPRVSDLAWIDPEFPKYMAQELSVDKVNPSRVFNGQSVQDARMTMKVRNFLRTANIWLTQSDREKVYSTMFGTQYGAFPEPWIFYKNDWEDDDMYYNREELVHEKEKCHDFSWFDKHVLMTILGQHHPWY
ncbi:hypothetical protein ACA910_000572 [Epithemia clementina (nom. ined.)]